MNNPRRNTPQEIFAQLQETRLFLDWKEKHPKGFLSHFFSSLSFLEESEMHWEVGFFDPQEEKITVFFQEEMNFSCRAPEKVFQEKDKSVEMLSLQEVKITLENALQLFTQELQQRYPALKVGQGFVVLQKLQENLLWNVSGMTTSFSVANLKMHAITGKILDMQLIEVVRREKGEMQRN